ncbi:MAG: hypothetical protein H7Y86_05810 [Rhizobacter sp.]|nr:hypothetical protein [Ferruginibacter sp.]
MHTVKKMIAFVVSVIIYSCSFAQEGNLLETLPVTKQEFIDSEKKLLATIDWLENTPLDQDESKHKSQYAILIAWLTNSPTVTIAVNSNILTFTKKNSELLIFFMAGWTKYCLENNYSTDTVKGNLAGVQTAIKIYKKAVGLKKDKEMQRLVEIEDKGELEQWVKDRLSKK